jgi:hypothetical protein
MAPHTFISSFSENMFPPPFISVLMMKAAGSSRTCKTTWHHNAEYHSLNTDQCEHLKSVRHFCIPPRYKPVGLWNVFQNACGYVSSCLEECYPCSDRWYNGRPSHHCESPCVSEQHWLLDSQHHNMGTSNHWNH